MSWFPLILITLPFGLSNAPGRDAWPGPPPAQERSAWVLVFSSGNESTSTAMLSLTQTAPAPFLRPSERREREQKSERERRRSPQDERLVPTACLLCRRCAWWTLERCVLCVILSFSVTMLPPARTSLEGLHSFSTFPKSRSLVPSLSPSFPVSLFPPPAFFPASFMSHDLSVCNSHSALVGVTPVPKLQYNQESSLFRLFVYFI